MIVLIPDLCTLTNFVVNKRFKQVPNLNIFIQDYTGEKLFACSNCENPLVVIHVRIQRGGQRVRTLPWKTTKTIGLLNNTGPDPLKITKLPIQHSMLGYHRPASETPLMAFRWRAVNGPPIVVYGSFPLHQTKKKSLTPSDKTFWIRACDSNLKTHMLVHT